MTGTNPAPLTATGPIHGLSLAAQGMALPPKRALTDAPAAKPAAGPGANLDSLGSSLGRILRPQAAYRWLLPSLAAITPQYIEATLRGALAGNHVQAWELFDLMLDSWPELAACVQELTDGVLSRKVMYEAWRDEEEKPAPEAVNRCQLVSSALRRMRPDPAADENNLRGTIKDLVSARILGVTVLEVAWQQLDLGPVVGECWGPQSTFWVHPVCYAWSMEGRLGLRNELNDLRADTRVAMARDKGQVPGVWNSVSWQPRPSQVMDFPPEKFLIAIHKAKTGTALAGPMLRPLAWWWLAANFSAEYLLNFAQLFGLPFRMAHYEKGAQQATIDNLCNMLQNVGSAGWGAFEDGSKLELIDAKGGGDRSPQGDLLDRADRYARMLILHQTLSGSQDASKGGGKAGMQAEAEGSKAGVISATADFVCSVINDQLIPSILRVNYGEDALSPTIRLLSEDEGDLTDAQRDQTLSQAGLRIPTSYLYKKNNIPPPQDGEDTIGGPAPAPAPAPVAGAGKTPPSDPDNPKVSPRKPQPEEASEFIPTERQLADLKVGEHYTQRCTCGLAFGADGIRLPFKSSEPCTGALQASTPSARPGGSKPATALLKSSLELDLAPIRKAIEARLPEIMATEDGATRKTRLAAVIADLKRQFSGPGSDPAVATSLEHVMSSALADGIAAAAAHREAKLKPAKRA